ncbi:hypothetical protein [Sphingomonas sanxanigenens]|uniref:Uncharacterized protein n=1 Tax=Sphingomonas sanxanigenens DSM 19645 = NX02 TaxID=1123269 RepID=W0AAC6_9SPHN|nr:hypothetical protein [Sphingomonas sanxanigenens]AHE53278.1 hypothetical protein NX02_07765 [Sphingomonas sanxanigenens DSM 19645 = NX02]
MMTRAAAITMLALLALILLLTLSGGKDADDGTRKSGPAATTAVQPATTADGPSVSATV